MKRFDVLACAVRRFCRGRANHQADATDVLVPSSFTRRCRSDWPCAKIPPSSRAMPTCAPLMAFQRWQLRAIALPQFSHWRRYNYLQPTLIEKFSGAAPYSSYVQIPNQNWNADRQGAANGLCRRAHHFGVSFAKLTRETGAAQLSNHPGRYAAGRARRLR